MKGKSKFKKKIKTIRPEKNSLYFRKWNFLALILKNLLHFFIFQEKETRKKISYISGNGNPKRVPYISRDGTLHFSAQASKLEKKISSEKSFYIFGKWNLLVLTLRIFLHFRKRKP